MYGTRSGTGVSRFDQRIKEEDVWMVLGVEQGSVDLIKGIMEEDVWMVLGAEQG